MFPVDEEKSCRLVEAVGPYLNPADKDVLDLLPQMMMKDKLVRSQDLDPHQRRMGT
jgi:hypothetical protein